MSVLINKTLKLPRNWQLDTSILMSWTWWAIGAQAKIERGYHPIYLFDLDLPFFSLNLMLVRPMTKAEWDAMPDMEEEGDEWPST